MSTTTKLFGLVLCLLVGFLQPADLRAQCPTSPIALIEQRDVDEFIQNFPNCTELNNNLSVILGTMSADSIRNLDSLRVITRINGTLSIFRTGPTGQSNVDLAGLLNLEEVTENLTISKVGNMDLLGFSSLERIGGNLSISLSTGTDFSGMSQLRSIGRDLELLQSRMESFAGLDNLRAIGRNLSLLESLVNGSLGIPNLHKIGGDILMFETCFESFEGMENLVDFSGRLDIFGAEVAGTPNPAPLCLGGGSLRGLSGIDSLTVLEVQQSGIKDLGEMSSLTWIEARFQLDDNLFLEDISGLMNLQYVGGTLSINSLAKLKSLRGLERLERMDFGLVEISRNDSLIDITSLSNLDLFTTAGFFLAGNPQLTVCDNFNFCNYFANGGQGNVVGNGEQGQGCFNTNELLQSCADNLGKVRFHIFYDRNQNQVQDPDEGFFSNGSVTLEPNDVVYYPRSNAPGAFFLDPGTYTVRYNEAAQPEWDLTTDSSSFQLQIGSSGSCDDLFFGVFPNVQRNEVQTNLGGLFPRCNTPNALQATVKNLGTTILAGTLWLELDASLDSAILLSTADTFVAPDRYGWFFSDLFPGYDFTGELSVRIPGPPEVLPGDSLFFRTYADFNDGTSSQQSAGRNHDVEIRCSYDPNDKLVDPAREGDWTLFEETLIYTIRFQNTGNDVAFDVQIRDTLEANLDASTFQVLGSSHPLQLNTSLTDSRFLVFDFPRIFLPDSASNPAGSQGYVTFQIDAVDGLPESTLIQNRAGIYFDANPPIITNFTRNLMVSELPVDVGLDPDPGVARLQIVPNPTTGEVFLAGNELRSGDLSVYDALGRRLRGVPFRVGEALDLGDLRPGVYWITLRGEDRVWSGKVLKQ